MPISSVSVRGNKFFTISLSLFLSIEILIFVGLAGSLPLPTPCGRAPHKAACEYMMSSAVTALPETPGELFDHSVKFSMGQALAARALAYNLSLYYAKARSHSHLLDTMNDCIELLDDSLDQLANVVDRKKNPGPISTDDVQTWLSAALTNQATCLETLENRKFQVEIGAMDAAAQNLSHFISNTLNIFMSTKQKEAGGGGGGHRRLLSDSFPSWVSAPERKLLQASLGEIEASAVVAKDGSGTHNSVGEAIALVASLAGEGRAVVHIKAGIYHENLKIPTKQKNVMLVGDGKGKTVIIGDRNSEDGWTTFQSATVGRDLLLFFLSFFFYF
jgi:pectinesterase inhibitor-like protein